MSKKTIVLAIFVSVLSGMVSAQQEKLLTHFIFDKMSINPASTGIGFTDGVCGTMVYRNQWDRVEGAPNSTLFNAEANIDRYVQGTGVGISFYNDVIGYYGQNNVLVNYAKHLSIQQLNGKLGIGAGIGITNIRVKNPDWITPDGTSPLSDPSIPLGGLSNTKLDVNLGLYFKSNNNWYAGISTVHLNEPDLVDAKTSVGLLKTARHYYAMGGYTLPNPIFSLMGEGVELEGNVLVRSDLVKFSTDINVRAIWNKLLYTGITVRPSDAVGIMLGLTGYEININDKIKGCSLSGGYSYDITLNRLKGSSWGSHELFVKFCCPFPPIAKETTINPRWL